MYKSLDEKKCTSLLNCQKLLKEHVIQIRSYFWSVFYYNRGRNNAAFGHFPRSEILLQKLQS